MTAAFPPEPRYGEDKTLRQEVLSLLGALPDSHPAREAYASGAPPTVLLRLLRDEPGPYDRLLKAVMEWNHRVLDQLIH